MTAGLRRPDAGRQRQPVSDSGRCPRRRLQGHRVGLVGDHPFRGGAQTRSPWSLRLGHSDRVNERTTWILITAALGLGWAVGVALLVVALTDWSTNLQTLVGGAISGSGVVVILWLRMKRLPAPPTR